MYSKRMSTLQLCLLSALILICLHSIHCSEIIKHHAPSPRSLSQQDASDDSNNNSERNSQSNESDSIQQQDLFKEEEINYLNEDDESASSILTWGPYRIISEKLESHANLDEWDAMFSDNALIDPFDAFPSWNSSDAAQISSNSLCEPTITCLLHAFWGFVGVAGPCGFGHTQCAAIEEELEMRLGVFHQDIILNRGGQLCGATGAGLKAALTGPEGIVKKGLIKMIGCTASFVPENRDMCNDFFATLRRITRGIELFFCQAYGRGVGRIPGGKEGQTKSGLLCYPNCRAGYYAVGPVCWETCHKDYQDAGAICGKNVFDWYFKKSYGNGLGYPLNTCPNDRPEWDAGLCYVPCKEGYKGVGPVCWPRLR